MHADARTDEAIERFTRSMGRPALLAPIPEPATAQDRFPLLSAADLAALPPARSTIKGVFPAVGLAAVAGPSASGKTFLVSDAIWAIAAGINWFGHRTYPCPVAYVGLEGLAGIATRTTAHLRAKGDAGAEMVRFITAPFRILNSDDLATLIKVLVDLGAKVVVIDTLNAAAPGADENASADMGAIIDAAKRLSAGIGGLVILVHHTGKDVSKGLRGHSSLFAAMDAVIEVARDGDARKWRLAKSKDGADGLEHPFRLRVVELGEDEDGDPITSCVVEPDEQPDSAIRSAKLPAGGNQKLIYDALRELLKTSKAFGEGGAPPTRPCIQLEEAIAKTREALTVEPDRKTERTRQAFTGLLSRGVIRHSDGWVYLA